MEKCKNIKIFISDVDGVLTNGTIGYGNYNDSYREFNVQDGLGFLLLKQAGIKTAIITSKSSRAVRKRAREIKADVLCVKVKNKLAEFRKVLKKFGLSPEQACYMGDDLLDLATLKAAGFSVSVPQACEDIKKIVDYVTDKNGGYGAAREVIELILKTQGKWNNLVQHYAI